MMLSVIIQHFRVYWASFVVLLSSLSDQLLRSTYFSVVRSLEIKWQSNRVEDGTDTSGLMTESNTSTSSLSSERFLAATDDQQNQAKRAFIESLDPDAICELASKYNNGKCCRVVGKANGSFNACFFLKFESEEMKWVVRIPIQPAFIDPWDKLVSEVTTMQYLEHHTQIPVPHVRAYGRDVSLTKSGMGLQMFLITDFVDGKPLEKSRLLVAEEEHRRSFYSQLIDIFIELHALRFPSAGSLMPNPENPSCPVLGPVMSMSAATLRLSPPQPFSSVRACMKYQFSLVSKFFKLPVRDHTVEDIREELFALDSLERIFDQLADPQHDHGPFVLNHQDLRSPNIIVDDDLNIQGIIDWEFSCTVPRQIFTPPSWITGHDSVETNKQMHAEFCSVLDKKSVNNELCHELKRQWYACEPNTDYTKTKFCVAHILRRPTDATDIFYDFLSSNVIWNVSDGNFDDVISYFFHDRPKLALDAQRRAQQCERYTQYLKDKGLYETELDKILAESKAIKAKYGWQ